MATSQIPQQVFPAFLRNLGVITANKGTLDHNGAMGCSANNCLIFLQNKFLFFGIFRF